LAAKWFANYQDGNGLTMPTARLRIFAAALILSAFAVPSLRFVAAQRGAIDTYAITNARIVTVTGPVIEKGTIVIRDGLIAAVGDNVSSPADARVIDGSGLTVYPGLIDANTNLALPAPSPAASPAGGGAGFIATLQRQQPATGGGPNSTQPPGLQPEIMAEDMIKPGGSEIESARNIGITTALTAPRTGIWVGQSALINLAGDTPQQMIVRSPVAMHVGFTPLRGAGFPNSLMGVFAALRQMLLDAQRYKQAQEIYERAPRGTRRPDPDKSLAALIPVIEGKMPVVMYADREREILRALDLAQEFKLRAIIAGGLEAAAVADKLRERNTPVFLSLNFPKRTTAAMPEADPEPLRVLRQRVEAQKTAAKLAAARVRFAFQSGSMTNIADFIPNAAKAIENGLARDDALRALTINAAEIFSVADRLGSIEKGKIANLTVVRGDIFDRNARVTNVFIDGKPVDLRPATAATAGGTRNQPEETHVNFAGTWSVNISLSGQAYPGTLVLRQQGGSVSGSLQLEVGTAEFTNGAVTGNALHATSTANIQGQPTDVTIDVTVTGDEMHGTVRSQFGDATLTGTRQPGTGP
jgi:imidazolonepropionase-like amidohydrolase